MRKTQQDKQQKSEKKPRQTQPKPGHIPFSIKEFFGRFHAVIFVITVFGGLAVVVFMIMQLLNESFTSSQDYVPPATETTFDVETIERVESLRPLSVSPEAPNLPPGRTNPF